MLDIQRPDLVAGVAGSGTMGRGIAQVLAQCGVRTLVFDAKPGAAQAAKDAIGKTLAGLVQKTRISQADADQTLARIEIVDSLAALKPCHLVVEAIVELLAPKQELFQALEKVVAETCILASNTSSLSVTAMASACAKPGRVAGYHFFNPVPVMKIVEVVDGELTEPWVGDALDRAGEALRPQAGALQGHARLHRQPRRARLRAREPARAAGRRRRLRHHRPDPGGCGGFPHRPVRAARSGRPGHRARRDEVHACAVLRRTEIPALFPLRSARRGGIARQEDRQGLVQVREGRGCGKNSRAENPLRANRFRYGAFPNCGISCRSSAKIESNPTSDSFCFVAPLGHDATTTALQLKLDPARTVAVDPLFGFGKRRTLMTTPVTKPEVRDAAHALLASDGVPVSVIRDSAGFVAQRVVAHIVNVGCDIVQQRIASPADLDSAVVLGLGYPHGPLAMGDAVGAARFLAILEAMHAFYQEPRYRPSPWLQRRAQLGVSLLNEDS